MIFLDRYLIIDTYMNRCVVGTAWTTQALAMLRYRDRYSQEAILKDFHKLKEPHCPFITLKGGEDKGLFIRKVIAGRYRIVFKFEETKNPKEFIAIAYAITRNRHFHNIGYVKQCLLKECWEWWPKESVLSGIE